VPRVNHVSSVALPVGARRKPRSSLLSAVCTSASSSGLSAPLSRMRSSTRSVSASVSATDITAASRFAASASLLSALTPARISRTYAAMSGTPARVCSRYTISPRSLTSHTGPVGDSTSR
jgi:hypothetical protein